MLTQFLLLLVMTLPLPVLCFLFTGYQISRPPENTPEETLAAGRPNGTVVACIGDSITHGRIGFNWVDTLRTRLPAHHFVNAGINGNVAWQVNERLDPVLACKPDIAIVLIGTNDAMASHNPDWGARYKRSNKLPEVPTLDGYATQLETLLRRLSDVPHVAVCTLPPLGEFPNSPINAHVDAFNRVVRKVAKATGARVIPVSKTLRNWMSTRDSSAVHGFPTSFNGMVRGMMSACFQHYVFGTAWDKYGNQQGNMVVFDHVHLGDQAGLKVADLVQTFIEKKAS